MTPEEIAAAKAAAARVIEMQLQVFNELVARQIQVLGNRPAAVAVPVHPPADGMDTDFGIAGEAEGSSSLSQPSPSQGEGTLRFTSVDTPKSPPRRSIRFPLTELQGDLYVLSRMGQEGALAYNEFGVYHLRGDLDLGALRSALQLVVDRHEAMRTVFPSGDGQEVLPELRLELPLVDVTGCPPERREAAVAVALDGMARWPFDFLNGPLARAAVLRLAPGEHRFAFSVHHIAVDGISLAIAVREVLAAYESFSAGRQPDLPLPMQYCEYAEWLLRPEREATLAADEAWWRQRLAGTPLPVFEPPTDRPRPPVRGFAGHRVRTVFSLDLLRGAYRLGRSQGATFYVVFLSLFIALLHRWTGQEELIVGGPTTRRPLEGGERLVGHCVDLLPLLSRLDLSGAAGGPSVVDFLRTVRSIVFDAQEHGDQPLSRLVRVLAPPRDASRAPLINAVFNPDPEAGVERVAGLEVAVGSPEVPFSKYELALHSLERREDLVVYLDYRADLFEAATIERLLGQLRHLLAAAVADPLQPVAGLPLLGEAERRQILEDWNRTAWPVPAEPVHRLFEIRAKLRPEAPAVVSEAGELTYGELDRRAGSLAAELRRRGLGPERIVAFQLDRSPELVIASLAVLKAGAACLPVDPRLSGDRLAQLLRDSGAVLLESVDAEGLAAVASAPPPESLAYVFEGVGLTHAGLSSLAAWHVRAYGVTPEDRATLIASPGFDASAWEIWPYLTVGASLHIPGLETVTSPPALVAWLAEQGVTHTFLPTPVADAFLAEPLPATGMRLRALLRTPALEDRPVRRPLADAPFTVFDHYGSAGHTVTAQSGRPADNTRVYLLDRALQPVPAGSPGELYVAGIGLARGYLDRPELTAERFVPDPFAKTPGGRLYRSGDRARWEEPGVLHIEALPSPSGRGAGGEGPRTPVEEVVAGLWASLPGFQSGGIHDDFFLLGGHSLLAAQLLSRVREVFGVQVPLRAFFGEPTVAGLALRVSAANEPAKEAEPEPARPEAAPGAMEQRRRQLSSRRSQLSPERQALLSRWVNKGGEGKDDAAVPGAAGSSAEPEVSPLVPIQPNGTRTPVFLVHPANGNAHPYLGLAHHLGTDQPLYAFQSIGLTGGEPLSTVPEMVDRYLAEIRRIQPHGPYRLGGWCVGGMFAYEMAQRLIAAGEEIEWMLLIDSHAPLDEELPSDDATLLSFLAKDFGGAVGTDLWLPPDELRRIPPEQRLDWLVDLARQGQVLPETFDAAQARRHWEVFRSNVHALDAHRLAPGLAVRTVLFRAAEQPEIAASWKELGWDRFLAGPIEVIPVEGNHYAAIREPGVQLVAREIADRLGS